MLSGDFFRFGVIYLGTLIGFAETFFVLFHAEMPEIWGSSSQAIKNTCLMLFQGFDWKTWEGPNGLKNPAAGIVLMIAYNFLTAVLLLNLLIAMMGNTFRNVISNAEREWLMQWADIILFLEGIYPFQKRDYAIVPKDKAGETRDTPKERYLVWQEGPKKKSPFSDFEQ